MLASLVVCSMLFTVAVAVSREPECFSRFDWDYKMLTQTVKIDQDVKTLTTVVESMGEEIKQVTDKHDQSYTEQEQELSEMKERFTKLEQTISEQEQELNKFKQRVVKLEETVAEQGQLISDQEAALGEQGKTVEQQEKQVEIMSKLQEGYAKEKGTGSSTYVRWGRTTCPGNGTETVYSGYAGGSSHLHAGAAASPLCLPTDPLWGNYDDSMSNNAPVFGAEYQIFGSYSEKMFKKTIGDDDVPCAVCRSLRASTVMIPARNACYPGWTVEYTGYLAAGHRSHNAATEFVCVDVDPEGVQDSSSNNNGWLIYFAEASCGSLKCPPYVNGRELTCVVCSK